MILKNTYKKTRRYSCVIKKSIIGLPIILEGNNLSKPCAIGSVGFPILALCVAT